MRTGWEPCELPAQKRAHITGPRALPAELQAPMLLNCPSEVNSRIIIAFPLRKVKRYRLKFCRYSERTKTKLDIPIKAKSCGLQQAEQAEEMEEKSWNRRHFASTTSKLQRLWASSGFCNSKIKWGILFPRYILTKEPVSTMPSRLATAMEARFVGLMSQTILGSFRLWNP